MRCCIAHYCRLNAYPKRGPTSAYSKAVSDPENRLEEVRGLASYNMLMEKRCIGFILLFIFCLSFFSLQAESRKWTRESDSRVVVAGFVSADPEGDTIELLLRDNKTHTMRLSELSQADQDWVRLHLAKQQAEVNERNELEAVEEKVTIAGATVDICNVRYPARVYPAERAECLLCFVYDPNGRSHKLVPRLSETADELGWILVGVDAYSNKRSQKDFTAVLDDSRKAVTQILETVPHDSEKVIFSGFSGGAWWSFLNTAEIHNEAAGVLSLGGWMSNNYTRDYPRNLKVAMVNGDEDAAVKYEAPDGEFLVRKEEGDGEGLSLPGRSQSGAF